jgi:hypothetical protein
MLAEASTRIHPLLQCCLRTTRKALTGIRILAGRQFNNARIALAWARSAKAGALRATFCNWRKFHERVYWPYREMDLQLCNKKVRPRNCSLNYQTIRLCAFSQSSIGSPLLRRSMLRLLPLSAPPE